MTPELKILLEIFGYIGTALVIISMLMTSVVKLRVINICGSVISMVYALVGGALPIVVMNAALIVINVVQLIRMNTPKITFTRVKASLNESSVKHFLAYNDEDTRKYFPEYTLEENKNYEVHLALIGCEAVGIIIGEREEETLHIILDYSIPKYRDLSVSTFLFEKLKEDGTETLTASASVPEHRKYLIRMGFSDSEITMTKILKTKENDNET